MTDEDEMISETMLITKKHITQEQWIADIHDLVIKNKSTYMETIIDYCEREDISIEAVSKLIDDNIRERVREDAERENLIKPKSRLDI